MGVAISHLVDKVKTSRAIAKANKELVITKQLERDLKSDKSPMAKVMVDNIIHNAKALSLQFCFFAARAKTMCRDLENIAQKTQNNVDGGNIYPLTQRSLK